jgi:uncharacterized protein (TIGR04255 family)
MSQHLFPKVDRVIYGKSPLIEVICQIRFPADLRIETTAPVDFQQRVRGRFPILAQQSRAALSAVPPELAKVFESVLPPPGGSTTWTFNTEDESHSLELQRDKLTLVSRNYQRWETFFDYFEQAYAAFVNVYAPSFVTRVGLRYRDVIQRSKLGLENTSWSSLLKPHVLAEIAQENIESLTEEASRSLLLRLPERNAKVRLQHGFAQIEGSPEQVYLIDCDFFVERTETANVSDSLQYFHGNAAHFFRWCISESLHQAMDPKPVS